MTYAEQLAQELAEEAKTTVRSVILTAPWTWEVECTNGLTFQLLYAGSASAMLYYATYGGRTYSISYPAQRERFVEDFHTDAEALLDRHCRVTGR